MKNLLILSLLLLGIFSVAEADISPEAKKKWEKGKASNKLQAAPSGYFDNRQNTVSNLEFFASNWGIFGLDVANGVGGGYWPRNSKNQYIFGGGAWFAAQKDIPSGDSTIRNRFVEVTYNPTNGRSWFVPGRVRDKEGNVTELADFNDIYKYRTYFSTDFDRTTGIALASEEQQWPTWPIWDVIPEDTVKINRYFGLYVEDETERNVATFPDGPAFISEEDIFATYKDTDLNFFDGGFQLRASQGYPLYVQIENMIYSWGFGRYKDFVFLKYDFINFSDDTLWNCWHAPIMDVDVARSPFTAFGARNDRVRYFDCDTTAGMAVQWTDPQNGERGFGFGYLGFDYLESPSVKEYYHITVDGNGNPDTITVDPDIMRIDSPDDVAPYPFIVGRDQDTIFPGPDVFDDRNFLRKTQRVFPVEQQLGLVTFRNWSSENDVDGDNQRYEFMSAGIREGDTGPGDKRYMMATGPYNMAPKDTARVTVAVILARTAGGGEADGSCEDMKELESIDAFAQEVYDNNFKSPLPPDRPNITSWIPLNNGMILNWDNQAELSKDPEGNGLDFLGYKIYRARRPELDTFSLEPEPPSNEFISGSGPLGWKEIASYEIPTPFLKATTRAGGRSDDEENYPLMDSLVVIGPILNRGLDEDFEEFDQMAIQVMRIPKGAKLYPLTDAINLTRNAAFPEMVRNKAVPIIATIDTFGVAKVWEKLFYDYAGGEEGFDFTLLSNQNAPGLIYAPERYNNKLLDSILVGTVFLNRSITPYNPLLYKRKTIEIDQNYKNRIDSLFTDGNTFGEIISQRRTKISKSITDSLDSNGDPVVAEEAETVRVYYPDTDNPIDSIIVNYAVGDALKVLNIEEVETTTVDTVFYYSTLKDFGNNQFVVDISIKRTNEEILEDREHANTVLDSIYRWAAQTQLRLEFPRIIADRTPVLDENGEQAVDSETGDPIFNVTTDAFEEHDMVTKGVMNEWFTNSTNDRTFVDVGDDNDDGIISFTDDPTSTEKLINNIPYYYRIVPFDEGDWVQNISQRSNVTSFTTNFDAVPNLAQTYPEAPPAGKKSEIKIIEIDSVKMGGIHNLNFFAVDQERLQQKYAGDTLELVFEPFWVTGEYTSEGNDNTERAFSYNLIYRNLTLRNLSQEDEVLFNAFTQFEPTTCNFGLLRQLSENGSSYILTPSELPPIIEQALPGQESRTITMHKPLSTQSETRQGYFTTGSLNRDWCYTDGFTDEAFGTLGFEYDFTVTQFGGFYRPITIEPIGQSETVNSNLQVIGYTTNSASEYKQEEIATNQFVSADTSGISSLGFNQTTESVEPITIFDEDGNRVGERPYQYAFNSNFSSFNNGPGEYLLEFVEGGEEVITLSYGAQTVDGRQTKGFRVPYLNIKITNVTERYRYDELTGDSILIPVPSEMENMFLPVKNPEADEVLEGIQEYYYPHPANLDRIGVDPIEFLGNYNIYSIGWVDLRSKDPNGFREFNIQQTFGFPGDPNDELYEFVQQGGISTYSGYQGKYYLSGVATDGSGVIVDFTNIVNVSGARFVFDKVHSGTDQPTSTNETWPFDEDFDFTTLANSSDFQVGDQVMLETFGSASGLPWPGFTVKAVVTDGSEEQTSFTEEELEDVQIAPNPYYITHENQQSPFAPELYFQRLPKKCTIEIYTQNGDLIKSLDHNADLDGDRRAVEVWNLMTSSGMRTQSQTLVALIKADGAEIAKTFSIVVGSYRVID